MIDMDQLSDFAQEIKAKDWEYIDNYPYQGPEAAIPLNAGANDGEKLRLISAGMEDSNALQFAVEVVKAFGRGDLVPKTQ